MTKTVGMSLGGGGAKGLAHIAILEALDEMGIKVAAISLQPSGQVSACREFSNPSPSVSRYW